MRRGLAGMVSMIAILGMAPAAIGCQMATETLLDQLGRDQPLVVARTTQIEWQGPQGWVSLPYETAVDGSWWIPTTVAKRAENADSLAEPLELRVTLDIEASLLPLPPSLPQWAYSKSFSFETRVFGAQLNWPPRFLAALLDNGRNRPLVVPLDGDCSTPRCHDHLVDAAIRVLPVLRAPELDHRRIADWAVDVALDDEMWATGLSMLSASFFSDPDAPKEPDEPLPVFPLMHFVSPSGIDQLVRAALKEPGLSSRLVASLQLPFETYPRELVTAVVERTAKQLSRDENSWDVTTALSFLQESAGRFTDPVRSLLNLFFYLDRDDLRLLTLQRHTWAELVRSGRLGPVDVPVDWWRPDSVAETGSFHEEARRLAKVDQSADFDDDDNDEELEDP